MTDFELLSIIMTMLGIVVMILLEYINNQKK